MGRIRFKVIRKDDKFFQAFDILIGCFIRLGSYVPGRSNID